MNMVILLLIKYSQFKRYNRWKGSSLAFFWLCQALHNLYQMLIVDIFTNIHLAFFFVFYVCKMVLCRRNQTNLSVLRLSQ